MKLPRKWWIEEKIYTELIGALNACTRPNFLVHSRLQIRVPTLPFIISVEVRNIS